MKKRLDILLTERGLVSTRSKARALIMEGAVFVDGQREDKAGSQFSEDCSITVKENPIPFVGRGGLKIQKALDEFDIDLTGVVAMDVGASTGGFTDCMLKRGAALVYSVDVGYGQLDYGLRMDERVVVMERTNIRNVPPASLDPAPAFSTIDVSFISLKKVIPAVRGVMAPGENLGIVALIKPQFEAGRESVGKNGVVRDIEVHKSVLLDMTAYVRSEGYGIKGLSYSPIKGPKGNIEFLIYITSSGDDEAITEDFVTGIAKAAHKELGNN